MTDSIRRPFTGVDEGDGRDVNLWHRDSDGDLVCDSPTVLDIVAVTGDDARYVVAHTSPRDARRAAEALYDLADQLESDTTVATRRLALALACDVEWLVKATGEAGVDITLNV